MVSILQDLDLTQVLLQVTVNMIYSKKKKSFPEEEHCSFILLPQSFYEQGVNAEFSLWYSCLVCPNSSVSLYLNALMLMLQLSCFTSCLMCLPTPSNFLCLHSKLQQTLQSTSSIQQHCIYTEKHKPYHFEHRQLDFSGHITWNRIAVKLFKVSSFIVALLLTLLRQMDILSGSSALSYKTPHPSHD